MATEVEGVVDVIEHRKNGWLVPANDVESLARGIDQLISEPNLRASLGKAGRAHAEKNYSIEKMCNRYDKLVQDLWSEKIAG